MTKGKILIIDDESHYRQVLSRFVELEGYDILQAEDAANGLRVLEKEPDILLVICDVRLPDMDGIQLLETIKSRFLVCEVILLTAYGTISDGVSAMKLGAFDYHSKDDGAELILPAVDKAIDKAKLNQRIYILENQLQSRFSFDKIIGQSKAIARAVELAQKVSGTNSTVLLEGETGTGKELFAQSIHNASPRRSKPFVAVNCSAIPKELLESEIFGHKKGAFTGAVADKKGLFEEANEGTLFLDEIGEMPAELQSKLLRVLEDQTFTKIGDTKPTKVNVRIVAATNRHLIDECKKESFRPDLYYRLSAFKIDVPALRDRAEDIVPLANHFVTVFAHKLNKRIHNMEPAFTRKLLAYAWPGNTRELKNIVERAIILTDGPLLTADLLPSNLTAPLLTDPLDEPVSLEEVEKRHIAKILAQTNGNKTKAAEKLGIGIPTLYRKIEQYGIG